MSWLFSRVLVAEYLEDISLDGEQSAPLNGSNIPQAYCAPDKMKAYSRVSRFGMMFKPLMESLGGELLMLYLADFHVRTSPPPEKEKGSPEKKVQCGNTWRELLARYDPDTLSWKTVQCSLLEEWEQSLETWSRWGSMRSGECFRQPMLAQIIYEKESGFSERTPNNLDFFHTPNTTGMDGGSNSRRALKKRMEMWPTPTVDCVEGGEQSSRVEKNDSGGYLIRKLNKPDMTYGAKLSDAVLFEEKKNREVDGGKLNPDWTEWLMGWPIGWTGLRPLEMVKSPSLRQLLSPCSNKDLRIE